MLNNFFHSLTKKKKNTTKNYFYHISKYICQYSNPKDDLSEDLFECTYYFSSKTEAIKLHKNKEMFVIETVK